VQIKKAVITAAGKNQRTLPLQTLVDRDGQQKTALAIIVQEVLKAGIEEVCVVICPGDQDAYRAAAGLHAGRLRFVEQAAPLGYGHAVQCAAAFTAADPFLLLVGDHLYVSRAEKNCAQQLVQAAGAESCSVSAVQATHESKLPFYGAGKNGIALSSVLNALADRERYLALELQGRRYDIGLKYGLLTAQLALALDGRDRDEVLSNLVEMLALKGKETPAE
jgi:UTP-glucose-1-phosphate uridylyltransferase